MHVLPLDFQDRRVGSDFAPPPLLPAPGPDAALEVAPDVDGTSWVRALDAARARAMAHGVSFAAVRDGELLWAGSSGRARDGRTTLAADAPMVIGSVTKTFVAATVLQLAEEGALDLGDPVRDHLPELRKLSRDVTLRQLLDHTSGLADLFNDTTRRGLEQEPEHAWTADEVLETLHAPWYEPGEGWAYANTNYYLLGMVVERVTEATLADVLAERFFEPLELGGTRLLTGADGDPLEPAWSTIFWASGAMASPAADLARWGDALYGDGLLPAASRSAMLRMNDHDYGLGVQRIKVGKVKGHGHTGLLNTYTTLLFHVPADDVTVALLVNRSHVDLAAMLRAEPSDGPSLLQLALGR
jgi:D-alanyl-D-alanine carboxypeptidase